MTDTNKKKLKILVACEYSGRVRDAFIRKGHDAISCDLLPSDSDFGPHYQGDVFDIINDGFDLLIAHPPLALDWQTLAFAGLQSVIYGMKCARLLSFTKR